MLRFALIFFVLAVIAGVLGYGGFAGTFSSVAVLAFYAFAVLLVLSLIANLFTGEGRGAGAVFGALVVAGLIGAGVYAWVDNGMTAERLGRSIDQSVAEAAGNVQQVAETAGAETEGFVERVGDATDEAADGDGR